MASPSIPTTLQPYFEKGIQAYTQGSYEYATDLLVYVIKQAPSATEARRYLRLAIQKQYSQHPPSGIASLAATILTFPLALWAGIESLSGRHDHAISLYEQLLCLQPRSQWLLMQLAASLSRAGLQDATLATYEDLLMLNPNHLRALRQLARLSMKRGQDEQARQCFERVLVLAPNDNEAQQGLRNLDALRTIKKGFGV